MAFTRLKWRCHFMQGEDQIVSMRLDGSTEYELLEREKSKL